MLRGGTGACKGAGGEAGKGPTFLLGERVVFGEGDGVSGVNLVTVGV